MPIFMIKKLSLPIIWILLVWWTVFGTYEIISSIPLSSTSIHENVLSGTEVADLSTIGWEWPYDYSLTVSGAGSDNDKFYISWSKLYLKFDPDYENPTDSGTDNKYTIELKTLDSSKPIKYAKDFGKWFTIPWWFYADWVVWDNYAVQWLMQDGSVYRAGPNYTNYLWAPEETGFVNLIPNRYATAWIKANWSIVTRWKIGSGWTWGPTGDGYVSVSSSPIAFAALHGDGSIYAWGMWDRGGSWAPTATWYTKIISNNSWFTALKNDGSVVSRWSVDITNMPTDTWFIDIFANGWWSFAAIKGDWSIKSWWKIGLWWSWAPTGTWFVTIAGNPYAFAALKQDWSIVARWDATRWWVSPAGTWYVKIYGWWSIFIGMKADGSVVSWWSSTYTSWSPAWTWFTYIYAGNWTAAGLREGGWVSTWWHGPYGWSWGPTRAWFVDVVWNYYAMVALHEDGSLAARWDVTKWWSWAPTGTWFTNIFALGSALAAVHQDGRVIYWWGIANSNSSRIWLSYKQIYDIEIIDQDEIAPIGTIVYDDSRPKRVTATLSLNESWSVTNNGGSSKYIFTETGSFTFEFVDLAGNTWTAIATVNSIPSNGWWVILVKDVCPDGDNSPSYYDDECGVSNIVSWSVASSWGQIVDIIKDDISNQMFQPTSEEIYQRAKKNWLTTMSNLLSARLWDPITRSELAKVMVNYFKGQNLDTNKVCEFDDIGNQSEETKGYIRQACQMWIMWVAIKNFNPDLYVTRAELATIISRSFWWSDYENKGWLYYERHIQALKQKWILTNTNPLLLEARLYAFLMLMRISDV